MSVGQIVADGLGISLFAAIIVTACVLIIKYAVKRTLEDAAAKELERFRSELSAQSATALEHLRTQLALPAELRRQVAAKKVAALLALTEIGEPMIRKVLNSSPQEKAHVAQAMDIYLQFNAVVRSSEVFLSVDAVARLDTYLNEVLKANEEWKEGQKDAVTRAVAARQGFIDLVREEFGVV